MNLSNLNEHPYLILDNIINKHRKNITFEFSKYIYRPSQLFDERETFRVKSSEVSEKYIISLIDNLEVNEELALHSNITIDNKTLHIPMQTI